MKKIRETSELELYKNKVSITDFYSVFISTPLGGVVIRTEQTRHALYILKKLYLKAA